MKKYNKMKSYSQKMITVLGPTASGKTTFAAHLALELGGEIISADSRQVYRGMDLGTGKDLEDYTIGEVTIPYHLIDIRPAGDKYTLFDYHRDFHKSYEDVRNREAWPILCGGTGLYLESVLKGYQLPDVPKNEKLRAELETRPLEELADILSSYGDLHNTTDIKNAKRTIRAIEIAEYKSKNPMSTLEYPPIESIILGIDISRDARRARISARLEDRINDGMIAEVERLLSEGVSADDLIYYGLEYKYLTEYVTGRLDYDEMVRRLEIAIHQFSKRQMTWFRGMTRRGHKINWIDFELSMEEKIGEALSIVGEY